MLKRSLILSVALIWMCTASIYPGYYMNGGYEPLTQVRRGPMYPFLDDIQTHPIVYEYRNPAAVYTENFIQNYEHNSMYFNNYEYKPPISLKIDFDKDGKVAQQAGQASANSVSSSNDLFTGSEKSVENSSSHLQSLHDSEAHSPDTLCGSNSPCPAEEVSIQTPKEHLHSPQCDLCPAENPFDYDSYGLPQPPKVEENYDFSPLDNLFTPASKEDDYYSPLDLLFTTTPKSTTLQTIPTLSKTITPAPPKVSSTSTTPTPLTTLSPTKAPVAATTIAPVNTITPTKIPSSSMTPTTASPLLPSSTAAAANMTAPTTSPTPSKTPAKTTTPTTPKPPAPSATAAPANATAPTTIPTPSKTTTPDSAKSPEQTAAAALDNSPGPSTTAAPINATAPTTIPTPSMTTTPDSAKSPKPTAASALENSPGTSTTGAPINATTTNTSAPEATTSKTPAASSPKSPGPSEAETAAAANATAPTTSPTPSKTNTSDSAMSPKPTAAAALENSLGPSTTAAPNATIPTVIPTPSMTTTPDLSKFPVPTAGAAIENSSGPSTTNTSAPTTTTSKTPSPSSPKSPDPSAAVTAGPANAAAPTTIPIPTKSPTPTSPKPLVPSTTAAPANTTASTTAAAPAKTTAPPTTVAPANATAPSTSPKPPVASTTPAPTNPPAPLKAPPTSAPTTTTSKTPSPSSPKSPDPSAAVTAGPANAAAPTTIPIPAKSPTPTSPKPLVPSTTAAPANTTASTTATAPAKTTAPPTTVAPANATAPSTSPKPPVASTTPAPTNPPAPLKAPPTLDTPVPSTTTATANSTAAPTISTTAAPNATTPTAIPTPSMTTTPDSSKFPAPTAGAALENSSGPSTTNTSAPTTTTSKTPSPSSPKSPDPSAAVTAGPANAAAPTTIPTPAKSPTPTSPKPLVPSTTAAPANTTASTTAAAPAKTTAPLTTAAPANATAPSTSPKPPVASTTPAPINPPAPLKAPPTLNTPVPSTTTATANSTASPTISTTSKTPTSVSSKTSASTTTKTLVSPQTPAPPASTSTVTSSSSATTDSKTTPLPTTTPVDDLRKEVLENLKKTNDQVKIENQLKNCMPELKPELKGVLFNARETGDQVIDGNKVSTIYNSLKDIKVHGCSENIMKSLIDVIASSTGSTILKAKNKYEQEAIESIGVAFKQASCQTNANHWIYYIINAADSYPTFVAEFYKNECNMPDITTNDLCTDIVLARWNKDLIIIDEKLTAEGHESIEQQLKTSTTQADKDASTIMEFIYNNYKIFLERITIKARGMEIETEEHRAESIGTHSPFNVTMAANEITKNIKEFDLKKILYFLVSYNNDQRMQIADAFKQINHNSLYDAFIGSPQLEKQIDLLTVLKALTTPSNQYMVEEIMQNKNATIDVLATYKFKQMSVIQNAFHKLGKSFIAFVEQQLNDVPKPFIRQLILGAENQHSRDANEDARFIKDFMDRAANQNKVLDAKVNETLAAVYAKKDKYFKQVEQAYATLTRRNMVDDLKGILPLDFYAVVSGKRKTPSDHYVKEFGACVSGDKIINKRDFLRIAISRSEFDGQRIINKFRSHIAIPVLRIMGLNEEKDYLRAIMAIFNRGLLEMAFSQDKLDDIQFLDFKRGMHGPPRPLIIYNSRYSNYAWVDAELENAINRNNIIEISRIITRLTQSQRIEFSNKYTGIFNGLKSTVCFKNLLNALSNPISNLYLNEMNRKKLSDITIEILATSSYDTMLEIRQSSNIMELLTRQLSNVPHDFIEALLEGREGNHVIINRLEARVAAMFLIDNCNKEFDQLDAPSRKRYIKIFAKNSLASLALIIERFQVLNRTRKSEDVLTSKLSGDFKTLIWTIVMITKSLPKYFVGQLNKANKGETSNIDDIMRIVVGRAEIDLGELAREFSFKNIIYEKRDMDCMNLLMNLVYPWETYGYKILNKKHIQPSKRFIKSYTAGSFNTTSEAITISDYIKSHEKEQIITMLVFRNNLQRVEIANTYSYLYSGEIITNKWKDIFIHDSYNFINGFIKPFTQLHIDEMPSPIYGKSVAIDILVAWDKFDLYDLKMEYEKQHGGSLLDAMKSIFSGYALEFAKFVLDGERNKQPESAETADVEFLINLPEHLSDIDIKRIIKIFATNSLENIKSITTQYNAKKQTKLENAFNNKITGDLHTLVMATLRAAESLPGYYEQELKACLDKGKIKSNMYNRFNQIIIYRKDYDLEAIVNDMDIKTILETSDNGDDDTTYEYMIMKTIKPGDTIEITLRKPEAVVEKIEDTCILNKNCDKKINNHQDNGFQLTNAQALNNP